MHLQQEAVLAGDAVALADLRSAAGQIGDLGQLAGARAHPHPRRDGQADSATVSFSLSADANVAVTLLDASGTTVGQVEAKRWRRAGPRTVVVSANGLADGAYVVRIAANATGGREATVDVPLTVVRTIGRVMLDPPAMTPNGDGRGDVLSVSIPLAAAAELTVRILRGGRWVATPFAGDKAACDCHAAAGDGFPDLVLTFSKRPFITRLGLHEMQSGAAKRIVVVGRMPNGCHFLGTDCVVVP